MILSNCEIHRALDNGKLVIDPEPLPRQPTIGYTHCPYDTHSVDLKLHSDILVPKSGTYSIDLTEPGLSDFLTSNSKRYTLTDEQPYRLKREKFILARTFETIKLPIDKGPPYLAA